MTNSHKRHSQYGETKCDIFLFINTASWSPLGHSSYKSLSLLLCNESPDDLLCQPETLFWGSFRGSSLKLSRALHSDVMSQWSHIVLSQMTDYCGVTKSASLWQWLLLLSHGDYPQKNDHGDFAMQTPNDNQMRVAYNVMSLKSHLVTYHKATVMMAWPNCGHFRAIVRRIKYITFQLIHWSDCDTRDVEETSPTSTCTHLKPPQY